jgi:hypothetical protein
VAAKCFRHRVLSYGQITYDPVTDGPCSFEAGLDQWSRNGWELVASFPSKGYAPGATTMFVFRQVEPR